MNLASGMNLVLNGRRGTINTVTYKDRSGAPPALDFILFYQPAVLPSRGEMNQRKYGIMNDEEYPVTWDKHGNTWTKNCFISWIKFITYIALALGFEYYENIHRCCR